MMSRYVQRRPPQHPQRGAAALIVVLVLFFVVSLVAAYTSRGMIFEQRTSINQLRSTQVLDIGDAGVEWALTKLNTGLIGAACEASPGGASTFRERYLVVAADGSITGNPAANPTCTFSDATGWACSCPTAGTTIPGAAGGPTPAFRVYFGADTVGARPNLIRVTVSACTDASANCLANPQVPDPGKGNIVVSASLGLKGAIDTIPAAAVTLPAPSTALDSLTLTGGTRLAAYNGNPLGTGLAIHAGGTLPAAPDLTVGGAPGAPVSSASLAGDATLSADAVTGGLRNSTDAGACPAGDPNLGCNSNRAFAAFFGAPRAIYRDQPSLVRCTAGCNSAALAVLAARNPRSVILVQGNATLDGNLGTAAAPIALVVEGDVTVSGAGTVVTGFIYGTSGVWTVTGTPQISGAIASETAVTMGGGGALSVNYDLAALNKLRYEYGSFARVPGGWRDFPSPTP